MAYIHIYKDTPTDGGVDGTLVSEGTGLSPITIGPLNATNNEVSAALKLAIRCESGYLTTGSVTITPTGTTYLKWALAPNDAGAAGTFEAYGAALTITATVPDTNYLFWAKAKATDDENPVNDVTVDFQVAATIAAE